MRTGSTIRQHLLMLRSSEFSSGIAFLVDQVVICCVSIQILFSSEKGGFLILLRTARIINFLDSQPDSHITRTEGESSSS